jgi:lysophospholipase L1-like esterase
MRARLAALIAALAVLLPAAAAPAAPAPVPQPPGRYLLGLGDSLTFGYHPWRFIFDAASFHTGFVDDLAVLLSALRPDIRTVNYGCPGETAASFLEGGCTYKRFLPLHDDYPAGTPQLNQALAFLRAHPGEVSPIVLSIGANDLNHLAGSCGRDPACVAAGLPTLLGRVGANLETILSALDAAAPSATVVLLEYYDPYAAAEPASVGPVRALNATIAAAAAAHGDLVADAFTPFNVTPPQPDRLCALTFVCGLLPDIHPTDDGYMVIALQIYAAAGYPALAGARYATAPR